MTVSSTVTRVTYSGNGVTTAFATTFPFFTAGEIEVIERLIATGGETVKTLTTHYTVSGGDGATGTVTAVGGAPSAAVQWIIRRKTARTQEIDYTPNDPFPAETHEQGLDRLKMNVQELGEEQGRALKFPKSDSASLSAELPSSVERAGKVLAFDADGKPEVSTESLADIEGAATSATAAAASATAAATSATAAAASATAADTSADAAAASAAGVNLPVIVADAFLRANAAGTAYVTKTAPEVATILAAFLSLVPTGLVSPYAGATTPTGWLLCDGSAVSRTTYADLFTAIATTYGTGDGSTTFNLPDMRGRVVAGQDDMGGTSADRLTGQTNGVNGDTLGGTGGEETHTLTTAEMPAHTHTYSQPSGSIVAGSGAGAAITTGSTTDTGDAGSGDAFNIVQPTIVLNYIIKT